MSIDDVDEHDADDLFMERLSELWDDNFPNGMILLGSASDFIVDVEQLLQEWQASKAVQK